MSRVPEFLDAMVEVTGIGQTLLYSWVYRESMVSCLQGERLSLHGHFLQNPLLILTSFYLRPPHVCSWATVYCFVGSGNWEYPFHFLLFTRDSWVLMACWSWHTRPITYLGISACWLWRLRAVKQSINKQTNLLFIKQINQSKRYWDTPISVFHVTSTLPQSLFVMSP